MQPINIVTVVDVIGALSSGSLRANLNMMDTGFDSENQGTGELVTACVPGQRINWIIYPIDVQTPVEIVGITFHDREDESGIELARAAAENAFDAPPTEGGAPSCYYWAGTVPALLPGGVYPYRLKLQMGKGKASVMYTDAPALKVLAP